MDDGTTERLTKNGALYPMVSWDSKTLVFTKAEGPTALYSMPAAGGDEQRIVDCVHGRSLAVMPPNTLYTWVVPAVAERGPFTSEI